MKRLLVCLVAVCMLCSGCGTAYFVGKVLENRDYNSSYDWDPDWDDDWDDWDDDYDYDYDYDYDDDDWDYHWDDDDDWDGDWDSDDGDWGQQPGQGFWLEGADYLGDGVRWVQYRYGKPRDEYLQDMLWIDDSRVLIKSDSRKYTKFYEIDMATGEVNHTVETSSYEDFFLRSADEDGILIIDSETTAMIWLDWEYREIGREDLSDVRMDEYLYTWNRDYTKLAYLYENTLHLRDIATGMEQTRSVAEVEDKELLYPIGFDKDNQRILFEFFDWDTYESYPGMVAMDVETGDVTRYDLGGHEPIYVCGDNRYVMTLNNDYDSAETLRYGLFDLATNRHQELDLIRDIGLVHPGMLGADVGFAGMDFDSTTMFCLARGDGMSLYLYDYGTAEVTVLYEDYNYDDDVFSWMTRGEFSPNHRYMADTEMFNTEGDEAFYINCFELP